MSCPSLNFWKQGTKIGGPYEKFAIECEDMGSKDPHRHMLDFLLLVCSISSIPDSINLASLKPSIKLFKI
jgi:hypothetical protein